MPACSIHKDLTNILSSPWICLVGKLSTVGLSMHEHLGQMHITCYRMLSCGSLLACLCAYDDKILPMFLNFSLGANSMKRGANACYLS